MKNAAVNEHHRRSIDDPPPRRAPAPRNALAGRARLAPAFASAAALASLLAVRVLWGFFGPRTARFSSLSASSALPLATIDKLEAYLKQKWSL